MEKTHHHELSATAFFNRRGYKVPLQLGDIIWRWFFVSFTQPAFGGFWRLWNPYIGYFLGKLYRRIGGDSNRLAACLVTFGVCGFGHDLLYMIIDSSHRFRIKMLLVFVVFGVLVVATSPLRIYRFMRRLHPAANVVVNLLFVAIGYQTGDYIWDAIRDTR